MPRADCHEVRSAWIARRIGLRAQLVPPPFQITSSASLQPPPARPLRLHDAAHFVSGRAPRGASRARPAARSSQSTTSMRSTRRASCRSRGAAAPRAARRGPRRRSERACLVADQRMQDRLEPAPARDRRIPARACERGRARRRQVTNARRTRARLPSSRAPPGRGQPTRDHVGVDDLGAERREHVGRGGLTAADAPGEPDAVRITGPECPATR